MKFKATVPYIGTEITVEADTFQELHEAIAGVVELNRSGYYLKKQCGEKYHPIPFYRQVDGNDFFGVKDGFSGKNVTFGTFKEKGRAVPFFPKGEDGFYDPQKQEG